MMTIAEALNQLSMVFVAREESEMAKDKKSGGFHRGQADTFRKAIKALDGPHAWTADRSADEIFQELSSQFEEDYKEAENLRHIALVESNLIKAEYFRGVAAAGLEIMMRVREARLMVEPEPEVQL